MAPRQKIRFCSAFDGVQLAYASVGSGPPLLKAANWLSHIEYDVRSPIWSHWIEGLSRRHELVRYDTRGCGLRREGDGGDPMAGIGAALAPIMGTAVAA